MPERSEVTKRHDMRGLARQMDIDISTVSHCDRTNYCLFTLVCVDVFCRVQIFLFCSQFSKNHQNNVAFVMFCAHLIAVPPKFLLMNRNIYNVLMIDWS